MIPRIRYLIVPLLAVGCGAGRAVPLWDAHTHLSMYGATALDSLRAYNVVGVRDLGANKLDEILQWREEINSGQRKGPRICTAGVILDGPKEDSSTRWIIRTEAEALHAVDSLARRKVDFIKTHNGLAPPAYFAILRAARVHHLKVASHLPRGIPAWIAADSGAGSIEHAAESMMASPIYAGYAKTFQEAVSWWSSPAGDSAIGRLKKSGVYFTPTLGFYAANVNLPTDSTARAQRRAALPALVELTRKMYRAGIPIMAGTDIATIRSDWRPGQSLLEELRWLRQAGLSEADVQRAASTNIERWLECHK
jgi:imidazolonepropionase-like amidohydrolase